MKQQFLRLLITHKNSLVFTFRYINSLALKGHLKSNIHHFNTMMFNCQLLVQPQEEISGNNGRPDDLLLLVIRLLSLL